MDELNKKTILLVEDEILIAIAEKMNLEKFGYTVLIVHSGEEAVKIFKSENEIELILMDIDLGYSIDGTDVAEIILKEKEIPIVFLSSHTEPEIVEKTEKITSYGYVVKNTGITVLDASIKMAFKLFEANRAIKISEVEYKSTVNNLLIGVVVYNSDKGVLFCNPEAINILGLTAEQMSGKVAVDPVWNFVHEDLTPVKIEDYPINKVISTNKQLNDYVLGINRPDREYTTWVSVNAVSIFTENERLEKVIVNFMDITERKRAEQALQENEERYRLLFETMISGFALLEIMYDNKGRPFDCRYVDVNPAHEKLTGLKSKDIIGKTAKECIANLEDSWIENYAQVDKTGIPITIENYVDGLKSWYRVIAYRPKSGYVAVTFEDITEFKQTEKMLLEKEDNYRILVENQTDMIVEFDIEGQLLFVSPSYCKTFNRTPEELIGKKFIPLIHEDDQEKVTKAIENVCNPPYTSYIEERAMTNDGWQWQGWLNTAILDENNEITSIVAVGRDISNLKQTEEKLIKKTQILGERNKELNCFYGLSKLIEAKDASLDNIFQETVKLLPPSWQYPDITCVKLVIDDREFATTNYKETGWQQSHDIIVHNTKHGFLVVGYLIEKPEADEGPFLKEERLLLDSISERLGRIIERIKTEESLHQYEYIVSSSTDMLALLDKQFNYLSANKAYMNAFNFTSDQLIGKTVTEVFGEEFFNSVIKPNADRCLGGEEINYEDWFDFPAFGKYYMDITYYPYYNSDNKIMGFVVNGRNITNRKQAEQALIEALQENKVLLRELQHRAKNSFMMISSMIDLAADVSISAETKTALSETGSRIHAVSELYDLLSSTDSVTEVRLDEYLTRIVSSLPVISDGIIFKNTFDEVVLPVKIAVPVGIIITELITNSMKHAFPDNGNGKITLTLKKTDTGAVFEVIDNGIGFPEEFNMSTVETLGLKLVDIITQQIDGSFTIYSEEDTKCVVEFPVDENSSE